MKPATLVVDAIRLSQLTTLSKRSTRRPDYRAAPRPGQPQCTWIDKRHRAAALDCQHYSCIGANLSSFGYLLHKHIRPSLRGPQLTKFIQAAAAAVLLLTGLVYAQIPGGGSDSDGLPNAPSHTNGAIAPPPVSSTRRTNSFVSPAEAPYLPLSSREKFDHFIHYTYSPYTVLNAAYNATYAQMMGDPSGYGGGMEGWGKRMGSAMAGTEARSFFGWFLFPTLLHQDPRYFPMYRGSVFKRSLHAVSRIVITRNDDGESTFNTSGLLGIAFTESLQNAWLPENRRGMGITMSRMAGSMQGYATAYLLKEFTPDIWRFVERHAPKKLLRLQDKVPARLSNSFLSDQP